MNEKLKEKVKESLSSVLPITLIVLVLSITLVPMEIGTLALFLTGAVLLIFGMGFFQLGAEMSMTPLGEGVGKTLAKREKVILVVLVSFALGTIITIAEPDLQVLANQVASIPNNVLIWTVAVGVGVFLALAVLRIFHRASLAKCLLIAYALLFALTLPISAYLLGFPREMLYLTIFVSAMAFWRHRGNIKKLLNGTENKFGSKK